VQFATDLRGDCACKTAAPFPDDFVTTGRKLGDLVWHKHGKPGSDAGKALRELREIRVAALAGVDPGMLTPSVVSNPSSNPKTSANVGASVIAALRNGAAAVQFA
jgi:hypothetical protein